jgi:putative membrane protein
MKVYQKRIMIFGAAVLFAPVLLFAQMDSTAIPVSSTQANQPQQQQPETPSMQDSGPNQGDVGQIMKDKMFLRSAARDGLNEVKLGQLAAQKAGSDDVKAFGQKMVDDHMKLNGELSSAADSMGVMLPTELSKEAQAEYNKLDGMSGPDFDTAYLTLMVKAHHRAMRDFRVEANSVTDPALKQIVVDGEGVIHEHLVQVDNLAREKGIPMPARGGQPKPPPAS